MKLISEIEGLEQFEGYGITSCGKVWSFKSNRFLTPSRDKKGYLTVRISASRGNQKTVKIHRLVALAYIPNPDNLETVDHKDENKDHNYVNNLRWMSRGENKSRSWSKSVKCIETGEIFKSLAEAEEKTGINRSLICRVCRGERNSTHNFHFEYV